MNNKGEEKNQNNSISSQDAENAAKFLKTLANPNRLIILNLLMQDESCVGGLEKCLNISQSALSQHLSRMYDEGILARRRESQQIFYTLKDKRIKKYLKLTQKLFYS